MFRGGDTNFYGYTWNDPVNFVDSEGLTGTTPMSKMDDGGGGGGVPFNTGSGESFRFNSNQEALVDIAKQVQRTGVTPSQSDILKGWAEEYGLLFRGPEFHPNRPYGKEPHFHIGPVDHIPNKCE